LRIFNLQQLTGNLQQLTGCIFSVFIYIEKVEILWLRLRLSGWTLTIQAPLPILPIRFDLFHPKNECPSRGLIEKESFL
jgi:hypothetical protein